MSPVSNATISGNTKSATTQRQRFLQVRVPLPKNLENAPRRVQVIDRRAPSDMITREPTAVVGDEFLAAAG